MSYDRMTSDDPTLRRDPVYRTYPDTGGRTIAYIVAAVIVLGLIYLAATAFWGTPATTPATTTIENSVPLSPPPATMTPAPEAIAPAPDALTPAPDVTVPPPAAAPDTGLSPAPAPAVPPATGPAQ